jgi:hypothetical protein
MAVFAAGSKWVDSGAVGQLDRAETDSIRSSLSG